MVAVPGVHAERQPGNAQNFAAAIVRSETNLGTLYYVHLSLCYLKMCVLI